MNNRNINKAISKIKPVSGIFSVRAVSKYITDRFISAKINEKLDEAKAAVKDEIK